MNDNTKVTHIITAEPSKRTQILFRAEDGIRLGQCKNETVVFGEEPNKCQSRVFLSHEFACLYLRSVAGVDAVIDFRNLEDEGRIILPGETIAMPGAMRNMN